MPNPPLSKDKTAPQSFFQSREQRQLAKLEGDLPRADYKTRGVSCSMGAPWSILSTAGPIAAYDTLSRGYYKLCSGLHGLRSRRVQASKMIAGDNA